MRRVLLSIQTLSVAFVSTMSSDSSSDKADRIERLRAVVNEDYERIAAVEDPYKILNLDPGATWSEAAQRYERYERFYRAENFQRLGDMDLTRKALDVRRDVGRAIVEIQSMMDSPPDGADPPSISELDPDSRALADIYYRDGLTYLRLGDLDSSVEYLRRAAEHDPSRGVVLAYLAYTTFRRRPQDPDAVEECRRNMLRATRMEADNADIHVLAARFFLKLGEQKSAAASIARVREIEPQHAKLGALDERLSRLT